MILEDCKLLKNDEVLTHDRGISAGSTVTGVLRRTAVRCSHQAAFAQFGQEFDLESLIEVEIPDTESTLSPDAESGAAGLLE